MWVASVGIEQADRDHLVRALSISPGVVATEMQADIRRSEHEAFPNVERFRSMHDEGQLADPTHVGGRIWQVATTGQWDNGAIVDLRQFDG